MFYKGDLLKVLNGIEGKGNEVLSEFGVSC